MKVFKRGNRWHFSGTIDGKQVRHTLGPEILTKVQAEDWLITYQNQRSELTLRNFIKAYLHESQIRVSELTLARYKTSLANFESYFGISRRIDTITSRDINSFAAARKSEGVSTETVNIDLRHVKAALNRAVLWELIDKAPKIEMIKTPKRLPKHLTVEQFKKILIHETDERFKRLWTFMVWTGVRRAEAASLKWDNIYLGEVPQASIIGKGDRQRVIPLLPPAVEALGPPQTSGLVFPLGSLYYFSHRFRKAARSAQVPAHLHMLRHTACTWMVSHGTPLSLVRDIAGHSDIKTTMGYAKIFAGAAYETLISAFGFKKKLN